MTETKKTTTRKTQTRKPVVEKAVVEIPEEIKVEKIAETTTRKKRVEIDRNEMIPCRSIVHGDLIYISNRTRARFIWEEFGSVVYLEMGELQDMVGSKRKYLHDGYLVIDDEEAAEALGLTKIYQDFAYIDNLEELFEKSAEDLLEIIPRLPKGMKSTLAAKARELVESGALDRVGKIRAIEQALGIDLQMFIKKN